MNDGTYLNLNGYTVKYNTEGNVQWCNQLYSNGISGMKEFYGSAISDNGVFVLGNVFYNNAFYNGNEYVPITSPIASQRDKAFVVKFDKETGLYLNYGVIPNAISTKLLCSYQIPPEPAKSNDYPRQLRIKNYELRRYN